MKGSEWFTRFVLEKNLNNVFGVVPHDEIQNVEIKLENMQFPEGFQSEIMIGHSEYMDKKGNKISSRSFIVKIFPALFSRSGYTEVTFSNEIFVFNTVIPFYKTINDSISNLFPEFYYGRLDFNDEIEEGCVIMENLQETGFRLPASKVFLDVEHLILAMKKLGEFHAYSYQAKKQNPKKFYSVLSSLKNTHYVVTRIYIDYFSPVIEYFFQFLSSESPYYEEKVRQILRQIGDIEEFVIKVLSCHKEPTSVLCHGDFLRNNLMFKYDEKNVPVDVKFIDLGNMDYSTPVVDLGLILYMNADQAIREEYWDTLIDTYYDSLKNTFPDNNLVPTKHEILSEFKYNVLAPCFLIVSYLPWMLAAEEAKKKNCVLDLFGPEYEEYRETPYADLPSDIHINLTKKLFQPQRTEKVLQIFRDVIKRGFV